MFNTYRPNLIPDNDQLITLEELCSQLMVSESTAYRLLRSKQIPAFKIGTAWKIPADSVKIFISNQVQAAMA